MASLNTNLDSKPQLSYDTSVMRRSLHAFGKIKAKARLFRRAGPAFRGFGPFPHYEESSQFGAFIASLEQEEKQLEKKLFTIKGLSCVRCTLVFSSEQHFESHRYFCGNPHILAGDLKVLKKHYNLLEDNGGMLFCPWCPLVCLNMVALFKHVRSCREAQREREERKILQRLPCPECATDFSHLQKLSNHMQSHYVADFTCDACKQSFPSANFLAKHLAGCKSKKPYRCSDCDRTFSNPKSLRLHVLSCRTTVQCLKCAKFFPGKFLCVEHVVMHIFSEWAKNGMQMFDGVLYRILRHKLPQEELYPSPCASPIPDPVTPEETPIKVVSTKADSRANSQEPALGLNKNKASTSDNLASKSLGTILASDQGSDTNSVASDKAASLNRTLKTNIVSTSLDPPVSDKAPEGIPLADEDNFSVIENEVYEIEHTIDEDEFLSELELCDSVNQLPILETSERLENTVQTETQQNLSDLAELFTPAIDIENGDTDKLTLTVVNVEGGANLFDWDDCDTEEVNCDDTEVGEPQTETSDFTSTAKSSNNVPLSASNENHGNEDEDSGIGATDDSDSNKDRSEVPEKYDDTSKPQEEQPEPLVDTERAEEPSYLVTSSEIFVSSSSCDTEVVVETSPVMEMVIQKNYSVFAEHCYASPPAVQCASKRTKNKKSNESGKSRKTASKKCSIEDTDESSREELDPLQKILSVMSKEARQNVAKKSKSLKHSSAGMKSVLVKTPHTNEEGLASRLPATVQCEGQSNTGNEVLVEPKNNISVAEDCTVSSRSLAQPQLKDNVACQSVQPMCNENDVHIMVQEETVTRSLTREDFLERVKPPMSRDKMMRKERSMLRHGFKQIATVLPQRKEPCGPKDASIPSSSATPMSVKPPVQTTNVSAKPTPAENLFSSNIIHSNIIYVQIPPNESPNYFALSQYGSLVVPIAPQPPVVVARCMPTISRRLPTANNRFVIPRPTQYRLQIQPQPKEEVPALTRITPALMHQSTSLNYVVSGSSMEEAPQTSILQVAPSGSKSTGSKIMAMFGGSDPSGPVYRPVFERILPSVSSAAVPNAPSTLLLDDNLNSLPPEETLGCMETLPPDETLSSSETLPPVQETSQTPHVPSINSEVDQRKEVAVPQESNHLEGNHLNPNRCGNNNTNVDDSIPVVKTSLLDESSISLPDSNLNALSPEETFSSKENLPPAQDIGGLPSSGPVSELKTGNTVLQRSRPLESNNISHNCNQLAVEKAPETESLKAVEEPVFLTTECKLADGLRESPAPVRDFVEEIAECNESVLDHKIKDLISCLDSNIATEESGKQEDQAVNSEKIRTTEVPSTVDLQTVLESSKNGTFENNDSAKEANPTQMSNVAQPKSFEVCHMQLCDSSDQVEFAMESVTNVDKPTDDAKLSAVEKCNYSASKKYKHTLLSHFQTNMCVSRKVMTEMKCFKRKRYGREGLHQSRNNVVTFNCNHCSQWSYSEEAAKLHTCLRAMIEEKISSKQRDKLIDNSSEAKVGGDEVPLKPIECQAASVPSNLSPYLSYMQMKSTVRHKKFVCDKCKIRCKSFSALLEHKAKAHDEQYSVECHICSKKFSRMQQLAVHVAKKHKPASNPSVQTPVQLIKERAMKRSLSRKATLGLTKRHHIHGRFSKTVQKDKRLSMKTDLQVAENKPTKTSTPCTSEKSEADTAQSSPPKESEVPTAPNSLASGSTVESECSKEETPVITDSPNPDRNIPTDYVPCSICNKLFKGRLGLSSHMVQAHRELTRSEDATIQCTVCNKTFKGKSGLTSHMNQAHRETFKCPLCLRRFCYVETMQLHITRDHPTSNINIDALTLRPVKCVGSVVSPSKLGEGESSGAPIPEKEETLLPSSTAENSSGTQINNIIPEVMDDVPLTERKIIKPKETKLNFVEQKIPRWEQADEKVETLLKFSTAENGSATQGNNTIPEVMDNVPLMERKIIKPKITKYKFVEETSPEKTPSLEQTAASSSGTLITSPDVGSIRKIKKVKWKIVKDTSPEKIPSPERSAKVPRLSEGQTESVPPLVLSLRKGKKHRYKCTICWKQYKKQEHLIQHQMRAHKPTSQLPSEKKGDNEEVMAAAPTEDQHPLTLDVPNCTTNLEVPNVCGTESNALTNAVQFSVPDSVQSSSENVVPIQELCSDGGEKSIEVETSCPPHDLPKEEINSSAPTVIPSQDHISSPPQDNSPSAKIECAICQIAFSAKGYLERHNIQIHGAPCQFRCSSCDKIFVDKRSLIFHKKSKHKQAEEDANTELLVKTELQKQRKPRRQCDECDKKFKNHHELRQHKRKVHKTPHHLKCTICGLYSRTKKLVAVHKLKVHGVSSEEKTPGPLNSPQKGNDENPVVSDLALQTGKEEGTAERKKESGVLKKELFKCTDCSLTFKYAASLQRHRKSMHVEREIHSCEVCGKRYTYAGSLEQHMKKEHDAQPQRQSRRSLRKLAGSDEQNQSTTDTLEQSIDPPISPSSERAGKNEVSDCPSSEGDRQEENSAKQEETNCSEKEENFAKPETCETPLDQDTIHTNASQDLQQSSGDPCLAAENVGHQENGCHTFITHVDPATFDRGSLTSSTAPIENYSSTINYDTPVMPPLPVGSLSNGTDHQFSSAPQVPQYQMPSVPHFQPASMPMAPAVDQLPTYNPCTLCGLCLPSWYALQEHYYIFHAYPNNYNYYVAPAPTPPAPAPTPAPYAPSFEYPAYPNQNVAYNNWLPQQHQQQQQFTNLPTNTVFNSGPTSLQELSSHSGAHCSVCGMRFPSLYALQEHYATHMAEPKTAVQYSGGFY